MSNRYEPDGVMVRNVSPVSFRTEKRGWLLAEAKRRNVSLNKLVNEIFEMGLKQHEQTNVQ